MMPRRHGLMEGAAAVHQAACADCNSKDWPGIRQAAHGCQLVDSKGKQHRVCCTTTTVLHKELKLFASPPYTNTYYSRKQTGVAARCFWCRAQAPARNSCLLLQPAPRMCTMHVQNAPLQNTASRSKARVVLGSASVCNMHHSTPLHSLYIILSCKGSEVGLQQDGPALALLPLE